MRETLPFTPGLQGVELWIIVATLLEQVKAAAQRGQFRIREILEVTGTLTWTPHLRRFLFLSVFLSCRLSSAVPA